MEGIFQNPLKPKRASCDWKFNCTTSISIDRWDFKYLNGNMNKNFKNKKLLKWIEISSIQWRDVRNIMKFKNNFFISLYFNSDENRSVSLWLFLSFSSLPSSFSIHQWCFYPFLPLDASFMIFTFFSRVNGSIFSDSHNSTAFYFFRSQVEK